MPQNLVLEGGAPWGFRITGGKDSNQPISIGRVTPGGKASLANLCPGDVILAIGGVATESMTLSEVQNDLGHFEHKFNVRPRPFGNPAPVASVETIDDNNNSVSRPVTRHVMAPVNKPQPPVAKLQKIPLCDWSCGPCRRKVASPGLFPVCLLQDGAKTQRVLSH
ncbi:hypothetical protein CRUP_030346 [Coryphaenoides rupestris]|nr:hypothetical protein CRUP_030346 [Coryphaenoides rupestris]